MAETILKTRLQNTEMAYLHPRRFLHRTLILSVGTGPTIPKTPRTGLSGGNGASQCCVCS